MWVYGVHDHILLNIKIHKNGIQQYQILSAISSITGIIRFCICNEYSFPNDLQKVYLIQILYLSNKFNTVTAGNPSHIKLMHLTL